MLFIMPRNAEKCNIYFRKIQNLFRNAEKKACIADARLEILHIS